MTHDDEVFADALGLPDSERAAFLSRACGGDAALRGRVEAMLANEVAAAGFLESPRTFRPAQIPEEKPGDRIGRYKLLQKIGEGGCGVVYMAEQEEPVRRRVALKVIKLGMDTKAVVARFEAERQALALMDHPNIAKVLDAGATDTGRPFFVMELVRGIPITAYCDENHLTPTQRVELFITVCQAIQHAHQKGIIHRDIKPSNILVTVNDGAATPKVIDFGIAKATQGRLTDHTLFTAFEQFIGTPVYMSPEQADMSSLDVDTRSDIYSLGVLLYELLTGQPPFDPKSFLKAGVDEIRHRIREVEPPKPSTRLRTLTDVDQATAAKHRGTVPEHLSLLLRGDLDWIVMRCLEKDRTRRYDTANGLVMDLQRHLRHEPVVARPPSTTYLLGKLVRRHRFGFAAAALVAVVLVAGTTFSTWQAIRATHAEHVAKRGEKEQGRLRANETAQRDRAENAERVIRRRAYISDINLIQQALAIDNLGRAQDLLNRQRPKPGETDLRGWEWRYLWQFCQGDALRPLSVKDDTVINSIAVSSDGAWLAAGEWFNGGLSIWNLHTREEIRVPAGRSGVRVAFSPREPLLAIAVGADSDPLNRVWLWDANTRAAVREIPIGSDGSCTGLFFSANGQTLVTATSGEKGKIGLWRIADGTPLSDFSTPGARGSARLTQFAVSRDLQLAAYASTRDNKIRLLDLTTGKERESAEAADELVLALAFSPDGKMLVSGAGFAESTIRLWDTRSLEEIGRLEGHRSLVSQIVFSPDGRTLASASGDHTIRIWDVDTRRLIRTLRGHRSVVNSLALLPDGRTLVSGSKDGAIMVWDTETDRLKNAKIRIPNGPAAWQFSGEADAIIAVEAVGRSVDRVVEWSGRDLQNQKVLIDLKSFEFSRALLASDRPLVAAYTPTKQIQVWDWQRRTMVREFTLEEGEENLESAAFLRGGEKILIGRARADRSAALEEWELIAGRKLREWKLPSLPTPTISPDETYFVVAAGPGPFKRILAAANEEAAFIRTDFASGRQVVLRANTRESDMAGGGFSPDGRYFANGSGLGVVDVIDADSWQIVTKLSGGSQGMFSPAYSPDGMRLAIGSSGADSMMIWDAVTFERILTLPTPSSGLSLIAFSPDGNRLGARSVAGGLTGGRDRGAFYLWRAPSWAEIEAAEKMNKTP